MLGIISVSISILVVLAGLAMLAKSKKENLGKGYIFASYAAIVLGIGLFIGSHLAGLKRMCQSHGSCSSSMSQCAPAGCPAHANFGTMSCSHGGGACASMCKAGGHGGHGMASCKHGGKMKKMCKKMHHMDGAHEEQIEINVEVDDDDEAEGEEE